MQHEIIPRARTTLRTLNGVERVFAKRRAQGDPLADIEKLRVRQWQNFIDRRIALAFEKRDAIRLESTGRALGEIRKQLRQEIAEAIGQLRADMQRSHGNG